MRARRNYAYAKGPGYSVNLNVDNEGRLSIAAAGDLDIETATMLRDGLSAWIADTVAGHSKHQPLTMVMTLHHDGHPGYPARVVCACGWESEPMNSDEQLAVVMAGHAFLRGLTAQEA